MGSFSWFVAPQNLAHIWHLCSIYDFISYIYIFLIYILRHFIIVRNKRGMF